MSRAVSGLSRDEFVGLVERYNEDLLRLAFAMAGDRALAEDAVQCCWQAAWRSRDEIRDPGRVRGWLFTVTGNLVRRALRRQRLGAIVHGRVTRREEPELLDPSRIDLAHELAQLGVDDRELLAMRYGLGLTSEEIGEVLGLSAARVRRRLQRVVARLRKELRDG